MRYTAAQLDLIGSLQQQIRALKAENEGLKSGEKYKQMEERHQKEVRALIHSHNQVLAQKDKEIALAHNETVKVRRIFMQVNEDLLKEKEEALALKDKEIEKLQLVIGQRDATIVTLSEKMRQLASDKVDLQKVINDKDEKIQILMKRLNRNSTNSSTPTSKVNFRGKVSNDRQPSGLKPGAQAGHEGHCRPNLEATRQVEIPVPSVILEDPEWIPMTGPNACKKKKIAECILSLEVTEYVSYGFINAVTGEKYYPPLPGDPALEMEYGSSIKALAFLLNNTLNVPLRKTSQFFQWASAGALKNGPSIGWINGLAAEFSQKTEAERNIAFNRLMTGDILYTDMTAVRINGVMKNITVCTDKDSVLYFVKDHKGFEGFKGTPVELFEGKLVHDGDKTLLHFGSDHQLCNAHEIRYCQGAKENEPKMTWPGKLQSVLREGIHVRNQAPNHIVSESDAARIESAFDEVIELATKEYEDNPPGQDREAYNTFQRIKKGKNYLLSYLYDPDVDPSNNVSERLARRFKTKTNVSGTFRSGESTRTEAANASAQAYCDALGCIETAKFKGLNLYEYAKEVFGRAVS